MKVVVLALLALVGTSSAAPQAGSDLFDSIKSLLGLAKLAIPSEVVLVHEATIDIPENDVESGTLVIDHIGLTGLKSIDYVAVEQLSSDEDTINLNIGFSDLGLSVHLTPALNGIVPVQNHIAIAAQITDFKVQLKLVTTLAGDFVDDLYLLITLGDIPVTVSGIGDETLSEEVSKTVSENVSKILNDINTGIADPVSRIIKFVANIVLLSQD